MKYYSQNYYIISGAPGSGKSTILEQLKQKGYICVDEPAREIIAEQRAINGNGLYDRDKKLFLELMLSRSIYQYKQLYNKYRTDQPVIFDRGIIDVIGYAKLFEVDAASAINAAKIYQYNKNVLFLPSWQEMYTADEDRLMSFESAKNFGNLIRRGYIDEGYKINDVPLVSIEERVEFIINTLNYNWQ